MTSTRRRAAALIVSSLLALLVPVVNASSAGAVDDPPEFPTLALGSEGPVVEAWQALLCYRGYCSHPISGHFGDTTFNDHNAWQQATFGWSDGRATPAMWQAMVPEVYPNDNNWAVYALKILLRKNSWFHWAADLTWYTNGAPTIEWWNWSIYEQPDWGAVINAQNHRGAPFTWGVALQDDWRYLAWHYEIASTTEYIDGQSVLCSANAPYPWGTSGTVRFVDSLGTSYYLMAGFFDGASGSWGRITMTDFNIEHGGTTPGHTSHNYGLAIDVRPTSAGPNWYSGCMPTSRWYWGWPAYDQFRSQVLLQAAWDNAGERYWIFYRQHLKLIYFNDPVMIANGLSTYSANHDDHYHFQYCTFADQGYGGRCP